MGTCAMILLIAATAAGNNIPEDEVTQQERMFSDLWYEDFAWNFDALPTEGSVAASRIPYSGHMYLDKTGGTSQSMRKYDEAMNSHLGLVATGWEQGDTAAAWGGTRRVMTGRGFFRSYRTITTGANHWYGHCNGWSAAAIRHAEPQRSVTVNGVVFTPAIIKGLLAEIYMYNRHELLAGYERQLNPGVLHAILANWLGRASHCIVMDADPSKEKWNYPVYGFASSSVKRSSREVEVRTNMLYAKDSPDKEHDKSPPKSEMKQFHYMLELNDDGEIVGGYYYNDSHQIDFLWVPLSPVASGEEGNERGNPHLDVAKVLDIWRKSVPRQVRRKWVIVDPISRDRSVEIEDPTKILPRNIRIVPSQADSFISTQEPAETEAVGESEAT